MKLQKILVVLDSDESDWSMTDPLIDRAVTLGCQFDAALILLRVAYEPTLGFGVLASRESIDAGRLKLMASYRAAQEGLCEEIRTSSGLEVLSETVWSHDQSRCILETTDTRQADLILKRNGEHAYLLGLLSTTDWDLVRTARTPLWFVPQDAQRDPSSGIVAAIDQTFFAEETGEEFELDHECFDTAKLLSDQFECPLFAVHAYLVPNMLGGYEAMLPLPAAGRAPFSGEALSTVRAQVSHRHREAVLDFIDEHGIPLDDVVIREGHVDRVLTATARAMDAGLIVMGSTNKTWWDRVLGRVHAEPTLASAPCDVLFIRPTESPGTGVA
ncbi:MAG: universal stress protein [Pseudomonadales bacterium]